MQVWEAFLREQEGRLGKETVQRWLRSLVVASFDAGNLYLSAQDSFQISWFKEHIQPYIKAGLFGPNGRKIRVHLSLRDDNEQKIEKKPQGAAKIFRPALNLVQEALDPQARLEKFCPTKSNALVMKFIHEMLASPSSAPNPIFIHGESGSGKTHLLTAIGHVLQERGLKLLFVRAETFTEHVVAAIRTGSMAEFRNAYRSADLLIIDDVHLFARKGATQEELFHTFNTLHSKGKQIILSANSSPQLLEAIEPRLVSRFEWGIVLRLQKMDEVETREWIKQRAHALSLPLDASAIDFLVSTLQAQTKSLQSALHALTLRLHLADNRTQLIDAEVIKRVLADLLAKEKQKELNPEKIFRAAADYYGIRIEDLLGKSQMKESSTPRQMAMYLARHLLSLSYLKIGQLFSRNHSTVMSSVKLVEKKLKAEEKETTATKIELLRQLQLKS